MRLNHACTLLALVPAAWAGSGLTYSTHLREGFMPSAIATDSVGNVYLAGSTALSSTTSQTAATVIKLVCGCESRPVPAAG